jgi:delta 1-pyrroline-5-carboxylate dehydrogenase
MHLNHASHHIQQQIWPARGDPEMKIAVNAIISFTIHNWNLPVFVFVTDVSASLVAGSHQRIITKTEYCTTKNPKRNSV